MAQNKPERALWLSVSAGMGPMWEAERIENRLNTGTPDVGYSIGGPFSHHGWMELKVASMPAKATTAVAVPRLTPDQRNWLWRHGQTGGHCWLCLKVGELEPMLIPHAFIYVVGKMNISDLMNTDQTRNHMGMDYWSRFRLALECPTK